MEKVVSLLQEQARTLSKHGMKKHLRILPMYSGLPYPDQMRVFERVPPTVRKVVSSPVKCLPYFTEPTSSLQDSSEQWCVAVAGIEKGPFTNRPFSRRFPAWFCRSWWPPT